MVNSLLTNLYYVFKRYKVNNKMVGLMADLINGWMSRGSWLLSVLESCSGKNC